MRLSLAIEGNARLAAVLRRLRAPESTATQKRVLSRTAERAVESARNEYMVGQVIASITGELRDSMQTDERGLPDWIEWGSDLVQAPPLHWGWKGHGIEPHPYIARPLEDAEDYFPTIWLEELEHSVNEAAR